MTTWAPKARRPNKANLPAWPGKGRGPTRVEAALPLGPIVPNKANWPAPTRNGQGPAAVPGEMPWDQVCETKPIAREPEETQVLCR